MKIFKTFVVIFVVFFSIHLITPKVNAHGRNDWLVVNGDFVKEYGEPTPSIMSINEHFLNRNIEVGETLNFEIYLDKLYLQSDTAIESELSDGRKFQGNTFSIDFNKTGTYTLTMYFKLSGDDRAVFDITLGIDVGSSPEPPEMVIVNGIEARTKEGLKYISRRVVTDFEIKNPKENYEYTWDLMDGDLKQGVSVSKSFADTRLPAYLTIRSLDKNTNVYSDTYLKVDSYEPQGFKVMEPSSTYSKDTPLKNNDLNIDSLLNISLIALFILLILVYLKKSKHK